MTMDRIQFTTTPELYRITLDSPPVNVIDIAMMEQLIEVLGQVRPDRHLLVIDAAGDRAFSAGVSIQEHQGDLIRTMLERFHEVFRLIDGVEMPTVALVRHRALGGGCELALACDFVLAAESTRFGLPEIRLGVFPPVAAWQLQHQLPPRRGLEMMLTGEDIGAFEARDLGLINAVFDDADFPRGSDEWLGRLLRHSASSLRFARRAWREAATAGSFRPALERVERLYLEELVQSEDATEGLNAFLEKRTPTWRHR